MSYCFQFCFYFGEAGIKKTEFPYFVEETRIGIQEAAVFRCLKKRLMVMLTVNID